MKFSCFTIGFLISHMVASAALAAELPPFFSTSGLDGWKTEKFSGQTHYQIVTAGDQKVLAAHTQHAASGLGWEGEINLSETPWLHWCWRVSNTYSSIDERSKAGDDYPARVYAVARTGRLPWQVQALNYVWASEQPKGADWPNAFTSRAHLLALQSGNTKLNQWVAESRHLTQDFQRYFDNPNPRVIALALMSDSDNAGGEAKAWYSDLILSATADHSGCPTDDPDYLGEE
ncbi:hypothetical protein DN062_03035 [Nitrincola tibetensis]|uniref:DUF3047 domain-containing protein n=1 Tax=Nitrincola tibetensis TaxID=2219697 RepID=A0A364NQ97_9GAMM|nr:DUF3047 domain-containing protein [Nitrincola tibetensis]RAU19256.1 hypothetical protein DN062_03035 [Nitrincola tibetensis]